MLVRLTLDDLQRRLVLGIDLLPLVNLGVQPLTDLLRRGVAIDLGGAHDSGRGEVGFAEIV